MADAAERPEAARLPAHNPDGMRASGCAVLLLLIGFLTLSSFFTIGGLSQVLDGEPVALPFVVGSGYTQVAIVVLVWAGGSVVRSLDHRGTVSRRAVTRAYRVYRAVRIGCFVVVAVLAAIALVVVLIGVAAGTSAIVLGLMLVPAVLMVVLVLFVARTVRQLCRVYETHYPVLTEPAD
ncbi:hypothetical protein [Cryptosporangium minutisporangium]|uniref:DUF2975 domain-containing protein n=1 Tax=Cryptosporangium minutisporangium TaxID=113569 RepID=A0ABP6T4H1_9ACTN